MTELETPPPTPLWAGRKKKRDAANAAQDARRNNRHFPCPACGADLRYHPGNHHMLCTHCETEVPVPHVDDAAAQVEHSYLDHLKDDGVMHQVEVSALNCETCGASVEFNAEEHSRVCPFCDSAIVADVTTQRKIVPQGVLPFKVLEKQAHVEMRAWLIGRWFAPNNIEAESRAEHFNGIYVPVWTYDSGTTTSYHGRRGRRVGSGKNRRTSWTNVSGTVTGAFDDVLVSGTKSVSAEFKDALGPWKTSDLETYQTEFLAGFRAENHTLGLEDGFFEAQRYMRTVITDWIRKDIGGDRQKITSSSTSFNDQTFKHILLPVWITHYSLDKNRYRLSVNGCTGKVYGQRPFSRLKLIGASVAASIGASGVGYIVSIMGGAGF